MKNKLISYISLITQKVTKSQLKNKILLGQNTIIHYYTLLTLLYWFHYRVATYKCNRWEILA